MSDNVCPLCKAERDTGGLIWHVDGCPNKPEYHYPISVSTMIVDVHEYCVLKDEIARLKAALEQDEKEIVAEHKRYRDMVEQRDEARRWARKYYQLYLIERQNYLDTFLDGDEWDEV